MFINVAHTDMTCYALRKENWHRIMNEYPDLYRIVKQKNFNFYFNEIYRPLIKQKQQDID